MSPDRTGSAASLVAQGARTLAAAGNLNPTGEARVLLGSLLGRSPAELLTVTEVTADDAQRFDALLRRRTTGVPLQHLTGRAWFRHVDLEVGPGVFVPRPETEVMTGWALDQLRSNRTGRAPVVVELCTGSGAIAKALAAELPGSEVHAVELSPQAFGYAQRNLADTGVDLRLGDMADAFGELDGSVDLVIANPPYIPLEAWESVPAEVRDHDPEIALFSGADGLDAFRVVTRVAARLLRPAGWLAVEHAEVQHESAQQVVVSSGEFGEVRDHLDLTGRHRFVTAVRVPR